MIRAAFRSALALLIVFPLIAIPQETPNQSIEGMTQLLITSLRTENYLKLAPWLPVDSDIDYYMEVAEDQKPELFSDATSRQRIRSNFENYAEQVRSGFRVNFDSVRATLSDSTLFSYLDSISIDSSTTLEAGIAAARVRLSFGAEGAGWVLTFDLSRTDRGWTWDRRLLLHPELAFDPYSHPTVCECVNADDSDLMLQEACKKKYDEKRMTDEQSKEVLRIAGECQNR